MGTESGPAGGVARTGGGEIPRRGKRKRLPQPGRGFMVAVHARVGRTGRARPPGGEQLSRTLWYAAPRAV